MTAKMIGTLVGIQSGPDQGGMMIVSPTDNLWFVRRENFPPEFAALADKVEEGGKLVVLGGIFQGEAP